MLLCALTRFCGPNWRFDPDLLDFYPLVESLFTAASPQHEVRQWEYAMALLARAYWLGTERAKRLPVPRLLLDVGGAGSPFCHMLAGPSWEVEVVDPQEREGRTIQEWLNGPYAPVACLFSLSVLEHVEDLDDFLDACVRAVVPGGLLFLTMDAWDPPIDDAPDHAHFHWERKRIFSPTRVGHLLEALHVRGCLPFGGIDLDYRGNALGHWGYTFASLAAVKR